MINCPTRSLRLWTLLILLGHLSLPDLVCYFSQSIFFYMLNFVIPLVSNRCHFKHRQSPNFFKKKLWLVTLEYSATFGVFHYIILNMSVFSFFPLFKPNARALPYISKR